MTLNISEYTRLEEELNEAKIQLIHLKTKAAKEHCLSEIRRLERALGIQGIPYNSNQFDAR